MRLFIVISFLFVSCSCHGQSGGIGFWNPPHDPSPADSVLSFYEGFFLVNNEGGHDIAYSLPKGQHALVRYNLTLGGGGAVILGTFGSAGELNNPTEVKMAGNHLFVLDRGGTRITRINLGNYLDKSVVFNHAGTSYPFVTFAPFLQTGDGIGDVKLFGVYLNADATDYYQNGDTLTSEEIEFAAKTKGSFLLAQAVDNRVRLRTGLPNPYTAGTPFLWDVGLYQTMYGGVMRLAFTQNVNPSAGQSYGREVAVLDSDVLRYGYYNGVMGAKFDMIIKMAGWVNTDILNPYGPTIDVGPKKGSVATSIYEGVGKFTSVYWDDNMVTYAQNQNSTYWSFVTNGDSASTYIITKTNAPWLKLLIKLNIDGSWQYIRQAIF